MGMRQALTEKTSEHGVRPVVCVDWDGTLVGYPGWAGYQPHVHGEWLPGAVAALRMIARHCELVVLTARPEDEWPQIEFRLAQERIAARVTNQKPPAVAYIDDRAIPYSEADGWWATLDSLARWLSSGEDGWEPLDLLGDPPPKPVS